MQPKNNLFALLVCSLFFFQSMAQDVDTTSEKRLDEVIIKAFQQNRMLKDVPAAVNYIGPSLLQSFGPTSLVQAINATPGVHLEERSPGSYRFNIRGSSLRSPFGVRNVKMYYNDLPITDPSGNTYFNQLGFYNFYSMEIIKGPASSLYGAGTGGVVLIENMAENVVPQVSAQYSTGSFGLQNITGSFTTKTENFVSQLRYQHLQSNGYRDQSSMRRDVLNWEGILALPLKGQLKITWLYSDLYYQTPGALTLQEFQANPRSARPKTGVFPSAAAAKASVAEKTLISGLSYFQPLGRDWDNKTVLYGAFSELRNPGIRNYNKKSEPHTGGRTSFNFHRIAAGIKFDFSAGAEIQQGFFSETGFKNLNGNPDSLRTYDEINNRQSFLFAQASAEVKSWMVSFGGSWNQLHIKFQRFSPPASNEQVIDYNNEIAPRLAFAKKFNHITIYTSVAKGFSPPTTGELFPTGSAINPSLQPEKGLNYDLGIRGILFKRLYGDINGFLYSLSSAIVQRRDAGGGDYYINGGNTAQRGVEAFINYNLWPSSKIVEKSFVWVSYAFHNFHYKDFKQINVDYSGNRLPGDPEHYVSVGFDILVKKGWSASFHEYYSAKIALNDANTAYAPSYHLLGLKLGYLFGKKNIAGQLFAGADNLLNQHYSLGNDINAVAGRYYNAASGINYYVGISLACHKKQN